MMQRRAFTMIEGVMAIVVIGILAALSLPRLDRDLKQEAADNVLSAIRYTQHLALADDQQSFNNPKWQQKFWHIYFGTCNGKTYYAIGSDENNESSNNGRVDFTESAIDPANGKRFWAQDGNCAGSYNLNDLSPNVFIGKKYGITGYTTSGGCTKSYLGFDHLGRPYSDKFTQSNTPDCDGYMTSPCQINFTMSDGSSFTVQIEPETGYAYIVGESNS